MFPNLEAEMVRKGVTSHDIADALGLSYNTVRNKLTGKYKFVFDEVCKIKKVFFPNLSIDYLFEEAKETA